MAREIWHPEPYQVAGVERLVNFACQGLFWKPGLSKTSAVLKAFVELKRQGLVERMLVISDKNIISMTWPDEIKKWDFCEGLSVEVLHGPKKAEAAKRPADVYTLSCHVTALKWFFHTEKLHEKLGVDMIVFDESTNFKNHATACFKGYPRKNGKVVDFQGIRHYLPHFNRRVILTGDPRPNGVKNLWSQIYLLDCGMTLGRYVSHFHARWFTTGWDGFSKIPMPGAEEEITRLIQPLVHVVNDDVIKLPKLIFNPIYVELPPKAREIYDELERDFITVWESSVITAASAASVGTKLRQVASGGLYYTEATILPDGRELPGPRQTGELHNEKTEALRDLIRHLDGSPLLVAYEFKHDYDRIKKALGKRAVYVADLSKKQFEATKHAWNRGEVSVLVAQASSISHGLNLQESHCEDVCFYSQIWDAEVFNQFIRRVRRRGNKAHAVTVHQIVAKDTRDEAVIEAVNGKNLSQESLFTALSKFNDKLTGAYKMPTSAQKLKQPEKKPAKRKAKKDAPSMFDTPVDSKPTPKKKKAAKKSPPRGAVVKKVDESKTNLKKPAATPLGGLETRGRKPTYTPNLLIKWLVKKNPKRPGTKTYERLERTFKSRSVRAFLEAGGTSQDLNLLVKQGIIEIYKRGE